MQCGEGGWSQNTYCSCHHHRFVSSHAFKKTRSILKNSCIIKKTLPFIPPSMYFHSSHDFISSFLFFSFIIIRNPPPGSIFWGVPCSPRFIYIPIISDFRSPAFDFLHRFNYFLSWSILTSPVQVPLPSLLFSPTFPSSLSLSLLSISIFTPTFTAYSSRYCSLPFYSLPSLLYLPHLFDSSNSPSSFH